VISLVPIIVIVFLLASLFKIAFIYHVLYVLLAVALLTRLWTRHVAGKLELEREFEERALHGEHLRITLKLHNRGMLPIPWLRLHDRLPVALQTAANLDRVVSLGPGETLDVAYDTVCRQRGWYELGPVSVELGDVLGVNLIRRELSTAKRLIVYPRVLPINRLGLPSRTPFGDVRTHMPLYEDPSRVTGVRDYVPGDSMRCRPSSRSTSARPATTAAAPTTRPSWRSWPRPACSATSRPCVRRSDCSRTGTTRPRAARA
jgi:uncharacterized protein (DUF58 family)